jgi:DNA modification methylase
MSRESLISSALTEQQLELELVWKMRAPAHTESLATIYHGDCVEVMSEFAAASIDAIVCDPPYELGFMGKEWDSAGVTYRVDTWEAAYRVLKPGGHLIAFGGTRTFHRLTCALEDAGFEIRDCLSWLYGSGFPKSLDVSKAIDKAAGAERPRVPGGQGGVNTILGSRKSGGEAISGEAITWQGWGTALKPAWEPIMLARKPLGERNVAANVLRHGTGAINVDGCRLAAPDADLARQQNQHADTAGMNGLGKSGFSADHSQPLYSPLGRWPANLVLDEAAAGMLDEQSGELTSGGTPFRRGGKGMGYNGANGQPRVDGNNGDSGGASRFFYTAKADAEDRDGSTHPTVKPVELMKWLIRLVTPPEGVVLDPFLGSGSTVYAARELRLRSIGIEREPAYIAEAIYRLRQMVLL